MALQVFAPPPVPPPPATVDIVDETRADVFAREKLLDVCFGPARRLKTCERLREGRLPAADLALVARRDALLIGTIRLWPVSLGGRRALMLGPLAVAAEARTLGLGAALVDEALARAAARGWRAVILVGDAPYYARFGFERRLTETLVLPGPVDPARFLGLELAPGALAGAAGPVVGTGRRIAERSLPLAA